MELKNKKYFFNLFGVGVIVLWLVMIGLLIRNVGSTDGHDQSGDTKNRTSAIASPQKDWMEIYLKGNKIGYSVIQVSPTGDNYLIREEILLNLNILGQPTGIHTVTRSIVDQKFLLKKFSFTMISGAVSFKMSGSVEGQFILLEIGEGKERRTKRLSLSDPPTIGSALVQFFKGKRLELGQSFKFPIFDPSTMAQKELMIKVMAKETLIIRRIEYSVFRLEALMWGQPMTFWVDESGTVLKEKGFMGLTLIKSSAASAPRGVKGSGGKDFYELAAIDVKGRLRETAKLTYLKIKTEGLAESHFDTGVLDKGRQRFRSGMIEVLQEEVSITHTYTLPYQDNSGKMKPFLQPEINIESNHELIIKRARMVAGDTRESFAVAKKLMSWVYRKLEKKPVITVPSALEVLKTRAGDCNEHAVLLTALLRASGIPARMCVGIVYARGKFFYHAWNEAFLGQWISMDAALNQIPADATHVKLVEGGLDRQVDIIGLIGKLRLEIVDYGYDKTN